MVVLGMIDFNPGQTYRGQLSDQVFWDQPATGLRQRMSEHADTAGGADQGDSRGRVQRVPADMGAAARANPVRCERLVEGANDAFLEHRAGDVRPADHSAAGDS